MAKRQKPLFRKSLIGLTRPWICIAAKLPCNNLPYESLESFYFALYRGPARSWPVRSPADLAWPKHRGPAVVFGNGCGANHAQPCHPTQGTVGSKPMAGHAGTFARSPREFPGSLCGMPWAGWRRTDSRGPESLPEGSGFACASNPKPHRWRDPLHHSEWRAADRNAGVGQTPRRAGRRQLEVGSLHPRPASAHQGGACAAVIYGRFGSLCGLSVLPEVPRANLRTLAEDTHGECRSRSSRTS